MCNNIYELARNKLKLYVGNYSEYLEKKSVEAEIEENTERRIESVLRFEREWLLRGPCARGTKIKARIQRDEQLINREKFQADKGFTFEVKGKRLGGKVLELHKICKNFEKAGKENEKSVSVINNFSYVFTIYVVIITVYRSLVEVLRLLWVRHIEHLFVVGKKIIQNPYDETAIVA